MIRRSPGWTTLRAAASRLRCPVCRSDLALWESALVCPQGHSFDVGRQGHVSLSAGAGGRRTRGDDAGMVSARARFLARGVYDPLAAEVAGAAAAAAPARAEMTGWLADLGCGTGFYAGRALEHMPGWRALALDASTAAVRTALRAHDGIAGIACDLWRDLPLADGAADVGLDVFAPRNGAEYARVLAPDGALVVVTPTPEHLRELAGLPGMPRVDPDKEARLGDELAPHWRRAERRSVTFVVELDEEAVRDLVGMGPAAHHVDPAGLGRAVGGLEAEAVAFTVSAHVDTWTRV